MCYALLVHHIISPLIGRKCALDQQSMAPSRVGSRQSVGARVFVYCVARRLSAAARMHCTPELFVQR